MSAQAVVLLAALMVGHFLGDSTPLSTPRMLEAKARGGPLLPIVAHAAVHAVLTGLAVMAVARPAPAVLALALVIEFVSHFSLDAFRARLGVRVPALANPGDGLFWTALGLDQLAHGLVLVWIAALVL